MEKITSFSEWAVALTNVLNLDENFLLVDTHIDGKKYNISLKNFYNTVMLHAGWQPTIMMMGDYFCANKLFYNGMNYTQQDVSDAKSFILDYFADFAVNAILAGYKFVG